MALSALQHRNANCKICNAFNDETLTEITADILLKRRSYKEICAYYTPLLPKGMCRLFDANLNNHRKHSDPGILVDAVLKKQGIGPVTPATVLVRLYEERKKEKLDKKQILEEICKERLRNLELLQKMLDATKQKYADLIEASALYPTNPMIANKEIEDAESRIVGLTTRIDNIHDALQQVLIKELNSDKNLSESSTTIINQSTVVVFHDRLKAFLDEVIPFLLHHEVFQERQLEGRNIIKQISGMMDKHITPIFDKAKELPGHLAEVSK